MKEKIKIIDITEEFKEMIQKNKKLFEELGK